MQHHGPSSISTGALVVLTVALVLAVVLVLLLRFRAFWAVLVLFSNCDY